MLGALLGVGASLLGGAMQSSAANKAAKAQEGAANRQIDMAQNVYNDQKQMLSPYVQSGNTANAAYNYLLGLGEAPMIGGQPLAITTIPGTTAPRTSSGYTAGVQRGPSGRMDDRNFLATVTGGNRTMGGSTTPATYRTSDGRTFSTMEEAQAWANANPTGGTKYGGFQASPGYQYRLNQGLDAVQSSAAARGMLNSGATMNAVNAEAQGQASNEWNNYLNRLMGQADNGQNAALGTSAAAGNMGQMGANALGFIGDARSAGAIGQGNAWNTAFENALGAWKYGATTGGGSLAPTTSIRPQARPW